MNRQVPILDSILFEDGVPIYKGSWHGRYCCNKGVDLSKNGSQRRSAEINCNMTMREILDVIVWPYSSFLCLICSMILFDPSSPTVFTLTLIDPWFETSYLFLNQLEFYSPSTYLRWLRAWPALPFGPSSHGPSLQPKRTKKDQCHRIWSKNIESLALLTCYALIIPSRDHHPTKTPEPAKALFQ